MVTLYLGEWKLENLGDVSVVGGLSIYSFETESTCGQIPQFPLFGLRMYVSCVEILQILLSHVIAHPFGIPLFFIKKNKISGQGLSVSFFKSLTFSRIIFEITLQIPRMTLRIENVLWG